MSKTSLMVILLSVLATERIINNHFRVPREVLKVLNTLNMNHQTYNQSVNQSNKL